MNYKTIALTFLAIIVAGMLGALYGTYYDHCYERIECTNPDSRFCDY